MKMKKYLIVLSTLVLTVLNGCSKWDGDPITQEFSIDGTYTELNVADAFDVTVSDTVSQVIVTAGENIMPKVRVEKAGDKLRIYLKGWTVSHGTMKVLLPYNPSLKCVDLSGASDFRSSFTITAPKVEIDLSGASDFYGDIEAYEVEMDISGSSSIEGRVTAIGELGLELSGSSNATLEGGAGTLVMDLSGSSTITRKVVGDRFALGCNGCVGSMSGSSDAYIHCDGSIKVSLSGASDLHYTGGASTSGCSASGGSNVIQEVL